MIYVFRCPGEVLCLFSLGFKRKVCNHESTSWEHDFEGSPRTKIMKFRNFNRPMFSTIIFIVSVFWKVNAFSTSHLIH